MIVRLLLFASAREAAGCSRDEFELDPGAPLDRLLAAAVDRYGDAFARVLATARVWVNGDEPDGGRRDRVVAKATRSQCCPRSAGAQDASDQLC